MPVQQGVMSTYQLTAHNHSGVGQGGLVDPSVINHDALLNFVLAEHLSLPNTIVNVLTDHNKVAHDALFINAGQVDGVEGAEIVQRDGSVPLTAQWDVGAQSMRAVYFHADGGGDFLVGDTVNKLRIMYDANEIAKILGVSNAIAGLKISKAIIGAFELNSLIANNKVPDADTVDGIEGAEILQRDGSVPLTAFWDTGAPYIRSTSFWADGGGHIHLGDKANYLRLVYDASEIAKILGISNNIAGLKLSDAIISGKLQLTAPTELTIAGGAITVTKSYHKVDGEGDLADDLNTINGGVDGMVLVLRTENNGRDITVKDGAGNIQLIGGDFLMGSTMRKLYLFYDANETCWLEISRY